MALAPAAPATAAHRGGHDDPFRSHAEPALDFPSGKARHGDDSVRALRVRGRQGGIVAPDLARSSLRVIEEVKVVHRHEARRAACRDQQRVKPVHDVDRTREPLDRRRLEAVPQEIQQPDRDPPIDAPPRRQDAAEPVLPRAREEDQFVGRVELPPDRGSDLMHVLADPGTLAKCRSIVQQDAQVRVIVAQPVVAASPYTSIN